MIIASHLVHMEEVLGDDDGDDNAVADYEGVGEYNHDDKASTRKPKVLFFRNVQKKVDPVPPFVLYIHVASFLNALEGRWGDQTRSVNQRSLTHPYSMEYSKALKLP